MSHWDQLCGAGGSRYQFLANFPYVHRPLTAGRREGALLTFLIPVFLFYAPAVTGSWYYRECTWPSGRFISRGGLLISFCNYASGSFPGGFLSVRATASPLVYCWSYLRRSGGRSQKLWSAFWHWTAATRTYGG